MRDNSSATCYRADGTAQKRSHTPCNQASAYSMCCHNIAENGWSPDWCLPNGLCANNDRVAPDDQGKQGFWIESCTDPTWKDPACRDLKVLIGSCYQDGAGNSELVYCPDSGTHCCGRSKLIRECCSGDYDERTVFSTRIPYARVVNVTATISGEAVTTAIPTLVSAVATFSAVPTAAASDSAKASGLSAGAGAGIGVGAALGAVALLVLGALLWRRLRRKRSDPEEKAHPSQTFELESAPMQEMEGVAASQELKGTTVPHQLQP